MRLECPECYSKSGSNRAQFKDAGLFFTRHAEKQCNLGLAYCKGQGVAQSYVKVKRCLEKAAARGDRLAARELQKVMR